MQDGHENKTPVATRARDIGILTAVLVVVLSAAFDIAINAGAVKSPNTFSPEAAQRVEVATTQIGSMYSWMNRVDDKGVPMWYDRTNRTEEEWYRETRSAIGLMKDKTDLTNELLRDILRELRSIERLPGIRSGVMTIHPEAAVVVAEPSFNRCRTTAIRGHGSRRGMMNCGRES
jgi:hypothetical protein